MISRVYDPYATRHLSSSTTVAAPALLYRPSRVSLLVLLGSCTVQLSFAFKSSYDLSRCFRTFFSKSIMIKHKVSRIPLLTRVGFPPHSMHRITTSAWETGKRARPHSRHDACTLLRTDSEITLRRYEVTRDESVFGIVCFAAAAFPSDALASEVSKIISLYFFVGDRDTGAFLDCNAQIPWCTRIHS